jgi:adhesin transport system membrane fusion protein
MFGSRIEDEFVNTIGQAKAAPKGGNQSGLILCVVLGVAAFLVWAAFFELEESARAVGRVIPSQQVQIVQSLEGGIVRSISVQEGDIVEIGDVLMQIDDTRFSSQRGELLEREVALLSEATRLQAEASEHSDLVFPETLENRSPIATAAERQVFLSRLDQLTREIAVLQDQLAQRRGDLDEMVALRTRTRAILAPLSDEIELTEVLVTRGVVPQVDLLRLRSRRAELEGDILVATASEPRMKAAIQEVENQISAIRSSYVLSARQRLATLQGELAVVQEAMRAATDRVSRTQMRSPVRGTVNTLHSTTVGAVIQPGAPLVEIVPMDDSLLIEADVGPRDIAFIRSGERASVKITAYDYLIYGSLEGKVVRIGADTIKNTEGGAFFRVIVRTDRTHMGHSDQTLPITPGMVATVDIQTGRRTVLSYLAKPLLRARAEAMRER